MILTISAPISGNDLGYLLLKNPARMHSFDLPFGKAHIFYTQLEETRSKAALLLDIDPISLVRGRPDSQGEGSLEQYVNDRPYVSSSFLSTAMSKAFGTAMSGRSKERQELADQALEFEAVTGVVLCRGGEEIPRSLFEPLGYEVFADRHVLDEKFPEWGEGPYFTVRIRGKQRLCDLLAHLYVLIPVLDADKHYWVGKDEVEKLLRKGATWLAAHPHKEMIAARYLRYDRKLTREALARLTDEDQADPEEAGAANLREELAIEAPLKLWEQRIGTVMSVIRSCGAKSVIDLGCGEGKLLR